MKLGEIIDKKLEEMEVEDNEKRVKFDLKVSCMGETDYIPFESTKKGQDSFHFLEGKNTDLAGFEPAIYSLGGYRPIQARLQARNTTYYGVIKNLAN